MWLARIASTRSAYASRSASVHVPSAGAASSPAASPLMWRGASGSCSHRIAWPSGQRDGSSACGWPTQIVGTAGSMPRSASLRGLRHAVEAGRQMQQRDRAEPSASPCRRRRQRVVDLHVALAVAILRHRLGDRLPAASRRRAAGRRAAFGVTEQITPRRRRDLLARRRAARRVRAPVVVAEDRGRHRRRCGSRRPGRGSAPRRRRADLARAALARSARRRPPARRR